MIHIILAVAAVATSGTSVPDAKSLLRKYDDVMGPEAFESLSEITSFREDGSSRTYKMKVLKSGATKFRLTFEAPAAVRGQELLRQGDNLWVYLPNLKKPVRLAARESFQGGDFNNADVLRVNYSDDYEGQVSNSEEVENAWRLDLRAKSSNAAYDRVVIMMSKTEGLPLQGAYYGSSGKLLRRAEFSEVKSFGGVRRPSKVVMKNMLATKRYSVMTVLGLNTKVSPPSTRFALDDLGR